jgi:hypothetical protein
MAMPPAKRARSDALKIEAKGDNKHGSPILNITGAEERKLSGWHCLPFGVKLQTPDGEKTDKIDMEFEAVTDEELEHFMKLDAWADEASKDMRGGAEWVACVRREGDYKPRVRAKLFLKANLSMHIVAEGKSDKPTKPTAAARFEFLQKHLAKLGPRCEVQMVVVPPSIWVAKGKAGLRMSVVDVVFKPAPAPKERETAFDVDALAVQDEGDE